MDIFEALEDLVAFVGLEAILKGKEVETSTGYALGKVRTVDVRKHRAWMVINNSTCESGRILIDVDKIRTLSKKIILFDDEMHFPPSTEPPNGQFYSPVPNIP